MSVKGFNTGTGVEKYDYNSLDNIPITTNTRVKGDAEAEYRTGDVNLTKANIGLGNVDNTSDANKPVSTAQQTALNGKVDKVTGKQLSTEDYTTAEKTKLSGIEAEANKTVLDSTLTEEGQAADAKATGDAVADLSRQLSDVEENKIPELKNELVMLQRVTKDADRIVTDVNDWEKGGINTSGEPGASNYTIRTKYKYPISADTSIVFTGIKTKDGLNRLTYAYYYTADNTYIERNSTFVAPANAAYVAFVYGWTSASGQTVDAYGLANLVADWAIFSKSKLESDIDALQNQIGNATDDISDLQADTGNIHTQVDGISNDLNCGLFTFVDDDGYAESLEHWLDVSMASGIKITECVVTGWVGETGQAPNYPYLDMLTWDEIDTYNGVGFEFVSHSNNHLYFGGANVGTAEALTADVEASQSALIAHKCNPDFLVYPGGHHQDTDGGIVDTVVRTHFKGAVAIANVANTTPLYTYSIFRYSLLDTANGKQSITDSDGNTRSVYPIHTLQWFKDLIDDAIANKKWVVFMSHLYNYGDYYYNSDIKTTLVEVAKYITTQGGKIMRLSDAFAIRKNRFESAPRVKSVSYIVDYRGQVYDKH